MKPKTPVATKIAKIHIPRGRRKMRMNEVPSVKKGDRYFTVDMKSWLPTGQNEMASVRESLGRHVACYIRKSKRGSE